MAKPSRYQVLLRFRQWRTGRALDAFGRASAAERRVFEAWLGLVAWEVQR